VKSNQSSFRYRSGKDVRRHTGFIVAVFIGLTISGCSAAEVKVPAEVESTEVIQPTSTVASTATTIPQSYPDDRGFGQLISHPPSGELILIGGESNDRFSFEETWAFDLDRHHWTELSPETQPSNQAGMAAAYDSESDKIIAYFSTRLSTSASSGLERLSQTWAYDVQSNSWTNMEPETAPFGLMGARMAYDSESDRVILFGGADFTQFPGSPYFQETWAYDFNSNTWQQMEASGDPLRRSYFGFAYSSAADRVVAFGGNVHDDDEARKGELWAYDYNENAWVQVSYTGDVLDDHHPDLVYAENSDRFLYYVKNEFWEFDLGEQVWTELERIPETRNRYFLAMAYDMVTDQVIVFGGGRAGLSYDNATWIYDLANGSWEEVEILEE
jgi:N-acetylneuraminic acid mutarotase